MIKYTRLKWNTNILPINKTIAALFNITLIVYLYLKYNLIFIEHVLVGV